MERTSLLSLTLLKTGCEGSCLDGEAKIAEVVAFQVNSSLPDFIGHGSHKLYFCSRAVNT